MRLLVITDVHKRSDSPRSWKKDYNLQTSELLAEAAAFSKQMRVNVSAFCGDLIDKLDPDATPYWATSELGGQIAAFHGKLVTSVGNHDAKDLHQIEKYPFFCMAKVAGLSFARESGLVYTDDEVEIVTVNHDRGDEAEEIWSVATESFSDRPTTEKTPIRILIVHGPICPTERIGMYPEALGAKLVHAEALRDIADYVFYGDLHEYHGVYKVGNTTFCNPGSIARITSKELDMHRPLYISYLDTDDGEVQLAELESAWPIETCLSAEDILAVREKNENVENFIESIQSVSFAVLTPDLLCNKIESAEELTPEEKELAKKVVLGIPS